MKSFREYNQDIKVQELLQDVGYSLYKRDGLRWPSFVRTDSQGKRISGDKFLVNPRYNVCFQPPEQKTYSPVSFILAFPHLFRDYHEGMDKFLLVNNVCRRLLNEPQEIRQERRIDYSHSVKPFNIDDYTLYKADREDFSTLAKFYPYFKYRGISANTQKAFADYFFLASKASADKSCTMTNLSFPLRRPGDDKIYGFEERGKPRMDGSSGYKGKAQGSDGSRALWIANLSGKPLSEAQNLYWFESAYDAMAFYQLRQRDWRVRNGVFLSTGGSPTVSQFSGVQKVALNATHFLCFDIDAAGKTFAENFNKIAAQNDVTRKPVSEEMKAYRDEALARIESMGVSVRTAFYIPTKEQVEKLPQELKEKYLLYDKLVGDRQKMEESGLVPAEEMVKQNDKIAESYKDFAESLNKKLGIENEAHRVPTVRLEPLSGKKDWNEELLQIEEEKKEAPLHQTRDSGIDIDGDGITEQIEEDVPVDEKKHHLKAVR